MLLVYYVYYFKQFQKAHSSVGMVLHNQISGPYTVPFNKNELYSDYFKYLFPMCREHNIKLLKIYQKIKSDFHFFKKFKTQFNPDFHKSATFLVAVKYFMFKCISVI